MGQGGADAQVKVFRDPVHNLITIPAVDRELMLGLIDTPEFQRLRRIRQLGIGCLAYHGAEHSRLTHSLGTYHVARQMLDALRERYRGRDGYEDAVTELDTYRREILVAALLHDVGHGPFSHLFEKALPEPGEYPEDYPRDHEGWSQRIIRERFGERLQEAGVKVDMVTRLINKKNRDHLLAKDFISSQLDADRMDYLLRDSRAAGPRYGEFDLAWMLHALRVGKVNIPGETEGVWRLCFDSEKAVHVVEEYIEAREFMYVQVYIHHTTRAYEAMLRNVLALAAKIGGGEARQVPKPCPPALAKMLAGQSVTTEEYLSLDDFRVWSTLIDWSCTEPGGDELGKLLVSKCIRLVTRGRPYRFIDLGDRQKQDNALRLETDLAATCNLCTFSCYRDEFADVAYRNVFYRKGDPIYLVDSNSEPTPIEARSAVIRAISEIKTEIYRLYYDADDPKMVERLQKDGWVLDKESTDGQEEPTC